MWADNPEDMKIIQRAAAYILLVSVYGFTWLVAVLADIIPRRSWKPTGRIIVTGTFFNPNWYLAHITPLANSVKEVILVIDEPQLPMEKVRFICPPKWLAKIISRAAAKAIWVIIASIRYRPDLYMGYNLVAGGCTALVASSIFGRPSCYQMTGGQLVLSTVGVETFEFEKAGKIQRGISEVVGRLAISVIRLFDLTVVRGNKGKAFLAGYGISDNVVIITGSVRTAVQPVQSDQPIDIVYVGRLVPIKQVEQFITIVKEVSRAMPSVKAAIIGDGPLMAEMKAFTDELELQKNIEFLGKRKDVEEILSRSKIFILTSKSEGLSIALAEAMAAGVVPVVADVGELRDLVIDSANGYLIEPNNIDEYVRKAMSLLQDRALWEKCSQRAIKSAVSYCDIEVVSKKWQRYIQDIVSRTSGHFVQEVLN